MSMPTTQERYKHFRENAEIFVEHMRTMAIALERDGKDEEATNLRVWALHPWEAAIRDDESGDLWPICEACSKPIKDEADHTGGGDADFHTSCLKS